MPFKTKNSILSAVLQSERLSRMCSRHISLQQMQNLFRIPYLIYLVEFKPLILLIAADGEDGRTIFFDSKPCW